MLKLYYQIQHLKILVEVPKKDETTAIIFIDRPLPSSGYLSEAIFKQEINIDELKSDLSQLLPKKLDDNVHEELTQLLVGLVGEHCGRFGRILPNDLMTYIAEQFLIIEAMHIASGFPLLTKKQKQTTFADTYNFILGILPPNLRVGHNYMNA
ncbi:hypothetical protein [Chitinophaga flava]|uniref:Uncharacterized protein n=1 Tax=Chitinophaga flava TaxID=2259036 RepID=A0A365Y4T1_9BACT|nr:hypothetical protein [Chitinophaga flava]RBL93338.1 hypothetical protein DF182_12495 [Chitinophaga flava]